MLRIALLGVPDSAKAGLAAALADALNTSGSPATVAQIDSPTLAPGLANHDLVLLTGLDIWSAAREASDQQIRTALDHAGIAYRVIYGLGEERLQHALQACSSLLGQDPLQRTPASAAMGKKTRQWAWMCEKCSDPACEHRLLSDLLASRTAKG